MVAVNTNSKIDVFAFSLQLPIWLHNSSQIIDHQFRVNLKIKKTNLELILIEIILTLNYI